MKKESRVVFVLMVFVFGVLWSGVELAGEEEKLEGNVIIRWEKDPLGIVDGWIVDPDTGKPVNEIFLVKFFYIDSYHPEQIPYGP